MHGVTLHPCVVVENWKGSQLQRSSRSKGSQPHTRTPVLGKGAHITSGYEKAGILSVWMRGKAAGNPGTLLKGQHTNSHSQAFTFGSIGESEA